MNRTVTYAIYGCGALAISISAAAADICTEIANTMRGQRGIYIKYQDGTLMKADNVSEGVPYHETAIMTFYAPAASMPAQTTTWHVRTETFERSDKADLVEADQTTVGRSFSLTDCEGNFLDFFTLNSRFVGLGVFFDYHNPDAKQARPNRVIERNFHYSVRHPRTGQCIRTDDRKVIDNLWLRYGFSRLPDRVRVSRIAGNTEAQFDIAEQKGVKRARTSYSSEFRTATAAACFQFDAPWPTISSFWNRLFTRSRQNDAKTSAGAWTPESTLVVVHQVPNAQLQHFPIRWNGRKATP